MMDFKAKMHRIRFRLGLRPRPCWGSLQRSPRRPSWILGAASRQGDGLSWGRGGEGGGRAPKLLLNQGPQSLATPLPIKKFSTVVGPVTQPTASRHCSFFHSILRWSVAVSTMHRQSPRIAAFLQADAGPMFCWPRSASTARSQVWLGLPNGRFQSGGSLRIAAATAWRQRHRHLLLWK